MLYYNIVFKGDGEMWDGSCHLYLLSKKNQQKKTPKRGMGGRSVTIAISCRCRCCCGPTGVACMPALCICVHPPFPPFICPCARLHSSTPALPFGRTTQNFHEFDLKLTEEQKMKCCVKDWSETVVIRPFKSHSKLELCFYAKKKYWVCAKLHVMQVGCNTFVPHCKYWNQFPWGIGFRTGTGKPAVLLKRVWRVQVWYRFLAHGDTPRTHAAVSQVPTGIL